MKLGAGAPAPLPKQRKAEVAGVRYWESPLKKRPLPRRGPDGCLVFDDYPDFRPNLTPEEVLRSGSFGGGYYRPISSSVTGKSYGATVHEEFPPSWFEGLDVATRVVSSRYDAAVNEYKVKSGNPLDFWEAKGWMRAQDPYGWFQWYCRFFLGRRTEDDERQVGRWVSAIGEKGRWRTYLVGQCVKQRLPWNHPGASPVTRQTLLHWAYRITKADFDRIAPALRGGKTVVYLGKVSDGAAESVKKRPAAQASVKKRPSSAAAGSAGAAKRPRR